jgi:nucleotide-binding universal stress UspA family protein
VDLFGQRFATARKSRRPNSGKPGAIQFVDVFPPVSNTPPTVDQSKLSRRKGKSKPYRVLNDCLYYLSMIPEFEPGGTMSPLKHVLVATDFSEAAEAATEIARMQANAFGSRLTLLHAYPTAIDAFDRGYGEERLEIGHEVHEAIGKLKDRVSGEVKDLHTEVVGADNIVSCICDFAKQNEVDLIVMGAEGHSRVKDMLIGSVAERVARHAPCSVLLVR